MPANIQPVYPYNSQNSMAVIDPPLNISSSHAPETIGDLTDGRIFYSDTVDSNGSIVYRIRLTSTADTVTHTTVTAKLLYVFVGDQSVPKYALYKTFSIPATTLGDDIPNPEFELYFPKGLLIPPYYGIYVAASTNYATTSEYGDLLSYTVEAGDYIQSSFP